MFSLLGDCPLGAVSVFNPYCSHRLGKVKELEELRSERSEDFNCQFNFNAFALFIDYIITKKIVFLQTKCNYI
jgi:hypothetical protein